MNIKQMIGGLTVAAFAGLGASSASAAPITPIGSIIGGSGTVTINPANSGIVQSYAMTGLFSFAPELQPIFGQAAQSQFQFQANSGGTTVLDGNGVGGPAINRGTAPWQILNTVPGNQNSTLYGPSVNWTLGGAPNSPTGTITGLLFHDGFIHWYYGYDGQLSAFNTPGSTPLGGDIKPYFMFSADYNVTSATMNGNVQTVNFTLSNATISAVPNPATLALVGAGLLAMGAVRRRKQAVAA